MPQRPRDFTIDTGHPLVRGLVFAGLGRHVVAMTISAGPAEDAEESARTEAEPSPVDQTDPTAPPAPPAPALPLGSGPPAPVAIALATAAALGFLAVPLADVLSRAAAALGGGS